MRWSSAIAALLPLDTVESIWRVIISTFTYVQAPYSVHVDVSRGDAAMRDSARFHFGFTVPCVAAQSAADVIAAVAASAGDLGMFAFEGEARGGAWWTRLAAADAPKMIARLPFVERPDHPAGMPVFVISKPLVDGLARDVVLESVAVDRWRAEYPGRVADDRRRDRRLRGRRSMGLCSSGRAPGRAGAGGDGRSALRGGRRATSAASKSARTRADLRLDRCARMAFSANPSAHERLESLAPRPAPGILAIEAYVPGKSHVAGVAKPHKLSSNETPLGASPQAMKAFRDWAEHLELYPDGSSTALRDAIAQRYGLEAGRILCGNGSDELLALLAQVYLRSGRRRALQRVRLPDLSDRASARRAAIPVVATETELTADVDALLANVTPRDKDGVSRQSQQPDRDLSAVLRGQAAAGGLCRRMCCSCIDAAYAEYVTRNDYSAGLELVATCENVVMTRTFSKIHGLAGLAGRLGLCAGRM